MKRTILLLASLLACAFQALAQNTLDGTWTYTKTDKQDINEQEASGSAKMKLSAIYVFSGGTFSTSMKAEVNMDFASLGSQGEATDAVFYVEVTASVKGSMAMDGSLLTLTPDAKKKPDIEVFTDIKGVPGGNLMKPMLVNPLKKELSAELKKAQKYKVVSINETTLVLEDILSDKELKAGKKAERTTLTRK